MQKQKVKSKNPEEVVEEVKPGTASETIEKTDDLLDEIDHLLEDVATLTNYRQRGGE